MKFEIEIDDEQWKRKFGEARKEFSDVCLMDNIIRSFDSGGLYPKVKEC